MSQRITIRNINIHLHDHPRASVNPIAGLLAAAALSAERESPVQASPLILPAAINAELQGGIYAGPAIEDGKLIHLIAAPEGFDDLNWEDAKEAASECRNGGFNDWVLPSKAWLQIGQANGLELPKTYHWTSTPYGSDLAWVVGFEDGNVYVFSRLGEFAARPFRRLSI